MSDLTLDTLDSALTPTATLTQEQIDAFGRDGYLSIDSIADGDDADSLRAVDDRLFEPDAEIGRGDRIDLANSVANRSGEPRRALIMAFQVRPAPLVEAREFPWQPDRWYEDADGADGC